MEVRYSSREMQRICTEGRYMQRKLGAPVSKALKVRMAELYRVDDITDLLLGAGRWEQLKGDRHLQWSARLSANWRLIIEPEPGGTTSVRVVEVVDYHQK